MTENELMDKISEVIDSKIAYRIIRRPYDEEFTKLHGYKMSDITENRYIPCLMCGADVIPRLLMNKKGRSVVYCSTECKKKHAFMRLWKFTEETDLRATAHALLKGCLDIDYTVEENTKKRTTPLVVRKLLAENNRLLELILEELKRAHRPA